MSLRGGKELLEFVRGLKRSFSWAFLIVSLASLSLITGAYYNSFLGGPSAFLTLFLISLLQIALIYVVILLWGGLVHFIATVSHYRPDSYGDSSLSAATTTEHHWLGASRETVLLALLSVLPMLFYTPLSILTAFADRAISGFLLSLVLFIWSLYILTRSLAAIYKIELRQALRIEIQAALILLPFPFLFFLFLATRLGIDRLFT